MRFRREVDDRKKFDVIEDKRKPINPVAGDAKPAKPKIEKKTPSAGKET